MAEKKYEDHLPSCTCHLCYRLQVERAERAEAMCSAETLRANYWMAEHAKLWAKVQDSLHG